MRFLVVFLVLLFSSFAFAQDSKSRIVDEPINELPKPKLSFRPKFTLQKAFKQMEKYIEKEKIDTSKYYLSSVTSFQYGSEKKKKPMWLFAWGHENGILGNYLHIIVDMDGNVGELPTM